MGNFKIIQIPCKLLSYSTRTFRKWKWEYIFYHCFDESCNIYSPMVIEFSVFSSNQGFYQIVRKFIYVSFNTILNKKLPQQFTIGGEHFTGELWFWIFEFFKRWETAKNKSNKAPEKNENNSTSY